MTAYWCAAAWLPDGVHRGVLVDTGSAGTIDAVSLVSRAPDGAQRLGGLVLPGFANAHSHAFHRALRGRTHAGGGTFWTWREAMYTIAGRLDPDRYLKLATLVYAEMAVAGITAVGEFHYLHDHTNVYAEVLREAAATAGIRLTLLDTCYLAGGIDTPVAGVQKRFSDGTAQRWANRVARLSDGPGFRVGAAIHSVRAVPRAELAVVAEAFPGRPLHVHLSEQPAENEACIAAYGLTPTQLLAEAGALGPRTTAVHATHVTAEDRRLLGATSTGACLCPTTEADLADGIGPARELADAGSPLSLGSDQHAVIDPFVEARALEHGERLRTGRRGRFGPAELVAALTNHASIGWPRAGRIAPGAPADLVQVRLDSVRTAGIAPEQVVLAATASDVDAVIAGGRQVAADGHHETLGRLGPSLAAVIEELWR